MSDHDPFGSSRRHKAVAAVLIVAVAWGWLQLRGVVREMNEEEWWAHCGDGFQCEVLGLRYEHGDRVKRDPARALEAYMKVCSSGRSPLACSFQAELFERGARGVPRDLGVARHLYEQACAWHEPWACARLEHLGSPMPDLGKDLGAVTALYERGCAREEVDSCLAFGRMLDGGLGSARDPVRAAHLYERFCVRDHARACYRLAESHDYGRGVEHDDEKAVEFYERACDLGDLDGCAMAAQTLQRGSKAVAVDLSRALELFERTCANSKRSWSCERAARIREDLRIQDRGVHRRADEAGRNFGAETLEVP